MIMGSRFYTIGVQGGPKNWNFLFASFHYIVTKTNLGDGAISRLDWNAKIKLYRHLM